jgi:hypothetical protein
MRWTLRLKRHGGAQALLEKRTAQIRRIRQLQAVVVDEFLGHCLLWLEHNPLRVLSSLSVEVLDDIKKAAFPKATKTIDAP